jgi:hypothetical protein
MSVNNSNVSHKVGAAAINLNILQAISALKIYGFNSSAISNGIETQQLIISMVANDNTKIL